MSLKQNDTFNEYMQENDICPHCRTKMKSVYHSSASEGLDTSYYETECVNDKCDKGVKDFDVDKYVKESSKKNTSDWIEISPRSTMYSDGSVSYTSRYKNKKTGEIREGI